MPAGSRFASATEGGRVSGGKVRWVLGDLAPGASKTLGMKLKGEKMGRLAVSSTANADCADAVRATASTELSGIPAILMEVIDLEDPIEVGTNVTYEISTTNQGSAAGTGIRIVCTLPDNVSYVDSQGATSGSVQGQRVTFAPLASLAPKDKATWRLTVKGNGAADARFKVSMTSDQLTSPVEETEATNFYE